MLISYIWAVLGGLLLMEITPQGLAQPIPQDLDIYLVIGQSNTAGRAEITTELQESISGVYLFTGLEDSLWMPAKNPLNLYSTIRKEVEMQRLGPAYNFAKTLRNHKRDQEIGLVVNAKGGTALAEWMPGTHFYQEAISRVKSASAHGTIRGVIWHQGESDLSKLETYLPNLEILITQLRTDLGISNLPFVAGHIATDQPEREVFNKLIDKLPEQVPFTGVVHSRRTQTFDQVHFDTDSQLLMGKRYGKKMRKLLRKGKQ
ncbi:sialate O-acetylesterase [Lunatibacter salilacus]|uniref:sialate O-acetylesterase n=1 Tax=Lunatibacter salilacus TaxID=2483804 RepID=UPI00131CDF1E|nr:sialate O-acetylesterase [Lunatibacter salilacus]